MNLGYLTVTIDADDLMVVMRESRVAVIGRLRPIEAIRGRNSNGQSETIGSIRIREMISLELLHGV